VLHARVTNVCKFCLVSNSQSRVITVVRCYGNCLPNKKIFLLYLTPADVQPKLNRHGGSFDNGRPLPAMYRKRVLDLYHDGFGHCQIAREIRSSPSFVQKVIDGYNVQHTSLRDVRVDFPKPKIDENVLEYIEVQKPTKPSIYSPRQPTQRIPDQFNDKIL